MATKAKAKKPATKSGKAKSTKSAQKAKKAVKVVKGVVRKAVARFVAVEKVAARKLKAATSAVTKVARGATGHANIAPGFTANDAAATVAWYTDVLGFTMTEKWESDGQFRGGSLSHGGVTINIGQDDWKMGRDRVKGQGARMYITTNLNIDKYAADIKARGGNLDQEPADGWGVRAFSVSDPDGFKITFMSPKK